MERIKWWARNGEAGRQAIELGALVHMETASEACTDAFLLFASESGWSQQGAAAFPDPREEPEMGREVRVPAHLAGRFAGRYSWRTTGSVLRSARVWGALGSRVEVVAPAHGLSGRGPAEDQRFRGDVGRKRLGKMQQAVDRSQPGASPAQAPRVVVKGRARASRRAVKQAVEAAEAAARALQVAEPWVAWDNPHGGVAMRHDARLGRGRRRHSLDTTRVAVPWETGTGAGSGVVQNEDGPYARGSKLATVRTLRDSAGRLRQVALSPIPGHAVAWCRPWGEQTPVWRAGALRLAERGLLAGATWSHGQRQRRVDGITPLQATRFATQEAIPLAERAAQWAAHPARAAQRLAVVRGVEHRGSEWEVPLKAWVMRFGNKKQQRHDPSVRGTTDQQLRAAWIGRHDAERPESEPDSEQMQRGGWQRPTLSATR